MSFNVDKSNESPHRDASSGSRGPSVALIAFGALLVLAVIFFFQNGEETTIDFWFWERTTTIRWSIIMAVLLGVLLDRLFTMWWRRRKARKNSDN